MAESEKRGFFGRLFGGGKKDAPAEETEPSGSREPTDAQTGDEQTSPDETVREVAAESDQGAGQAAESALEESADSAQGERIEHPVIMPFELAPALPLEPQTDEDPASEADDTSQPEEGAAPRADAPAIVEDAAPAADEAPSQSPEPIAAMSADTPAGDEDSEPEEESAPLDAASEDTAEPEPEPVAPAADAAALPEPSMEEAAAAPKRSWFQRLREGLSRSSSALGEGITSVFRKRRLDADTLEELEDLLIQADLGTDTAITITERLAEGRFDKEISEEEVRSVLGEEIEKVLEPVARPLDLETGHKPHVVLLVGVNGTGKTTTIGKLAAKLTREGKKVMLAAGDTFRAAAVEQLKIWGERTGSPVVSRPTGADAAGLVFDAMKQAQSEGADVLLIDTAGRLQNRAELMAELEKVVRVIKKNDPEAPHSVLLTLDATTGQNAMSQVEIFGKTAGVTGLVMTKLDGTARGGILVAIAAKHALPVHFIGVGEGIDDLEPFTAKDFAAAIAGIAR